MIDDDALTVNDGSLSHGEPEKVLPAHRVDEIVKREKVRAADRATAEAELRHKAQIEQLMAQQSGSNFDASSLKNEIKQEFMQEMEQQRREAEETYVRGELDKKAQQYHLKMGKGSELFEDFKEITSDFEPQSFPNAVFLATEMENTPEIMYELAKNPSKLLEIEQLAERAPQMAKKLLAKLGQSISANLQAKQNVPDVPAPLSRLKSSTVGVDTGKKTVQDLRKNPSLRA